MNEPHISRNQTTSAANVSMVSTKPLIGILGGIASGKSTIAKALSESGFVVIDSDQLATEAWDDPTCHSSLKKLLPSAFTHDRVDRGAVARLLFSDDALRNSVQKIVHPFVAAQRGQIIRAHELNPACVGFIVDSPLLAESGLAAYCDHLLFLDVPETVRLQRAKARGWSAEEYARRQAAQLPLEQKRNLAHYILSNATDITTVREQLLTILPTLLKKRTVPSGS